MWSKSLCPLRFVVAAFNSKLMQYDDFWTNLNIIGSMGERGNSSEISSTFYFTYDIRIWTETWRCNTSMTKLWYFCYDEDFDMDLIMESLDKEVKLWYPEIINASSHMGHTE